MHQSDLVIRGRRVVLPSALVPASIHLSAGRVSAITPFEEIPSDCEIVEAGEDSLVMPGLVDSHVHVNEPGRTEWEGFATATRAAAAGGVTTIVDMPLNSIPPTVDAGALDVKRKSAEGQVFVDTGFWGGAIPGNGGQLRGLHDAGVFGFKCFLLHSGVDEFPPLAPDQLEAAMRVVASFGALMVGHA